MVNKILVKIKYIYIILQYYMSSAPTGPPANRINNYINTSRTYKRIIKEYAHIYFSKYKINELIFLTNFKTFLYFLTSIFKVQFILTKMRNRKVAKIEKDTISQYVNYLQNKSDEELLNEFDVKYKKAVLHSIKNNGTVLIHQNKLNEFYEIYRATCERANIHCDSLNYFKSLINYLPHNTIAAVINDDEGNSIGAGFFIYDQHSCYCTHAGSIPGSKLYGGMKHLHYEVMKQMREKDVQKYDLTGVRINSTNEPLQGIFKFKKGFGGELKQGYLWKTDLNKFKCLIYDNLLLLKTKGKKRKDIIDQEN